MSSDANELGHEPIAIVGMSCRFPGGIDSPDKLWKAVLDGIDATGAFPTDRGWNLTHLCGGGGQSDAPGTTYTAGGGFLYDAADFDASFFNLSPREARITDPQHRIMLELAWEAIERGHVDPVSLRDSATGVYFGEIWDEYGDRFLADATDSDRGFGEFEGHVSVGNSRGVLSGRIAYLLGLRGPAITLDTSCSSALVALHLATRALSAGECRYALAGGITVMSTPAFIIDFSRQHAFSADGRSKAFSDDADGMGVGEGAGVLFLERLSDAVRAGHPVAAVIRGSAINQDGTSDGQTAPSQTAQEQLILSALTDARLEPKDIDVVEAHGTGTILGDTTEAGALLATYGQHRPDGRPLWIGSFKSNVGHSQAAAGVGGVIKMAMAMRYGTMPKTLHVRRPTPRVEWSSGDVRILTEKRAWDDMSSPRRSAVSSFGISGTNAHVVLEQYDAGDRAASRLSTSPNDAPQNLPVFVSAKSQECLHNRAAQLRDWMAERPGVDPADIAWSLLRTRSAHQHRAVLVGNTEEVIKGVSRLADGKSAPGLITGRARARKVAFVFPGQGSQWDSMGRELYAESPVFAARLRECDEALAPYLDWSITEVICGRSALSYDRVDVVQPCLFSIMVAFDALWRSYGVVPTGVIGHSQGEIAALCVAGALSLHEAARIVALRSQALLEISGRGAMVAVHAPLESVQHLALELAQSIEIAAVNSARSVIVAGDTASIDVFLHRCASEAIEAHMLPVTYASHSSHVEPLAATLRTALGDRPMAATTTVFYSSVSGAQLDPALANSEYWYENLRAPVNFRSAVSAALADGFDTFVEISPHPVLVPAIEQSAQDSDTAIVATGTLRRDDGGIKRFLQSAAVLHCAGADIDWTSCFDVARASTVDLPTYPFSRKRYWADLPKPRRSSAADSVIHPFLNDVTRIAAGDLTVYSGAISATSNPWLLDHVVQDRVILPGTAFLELALAVCRKEGLDAVRELTLVAPLTISPEKSVQIQIAVRRPHGMHTEISMHSDAGDPARPNPWTLHATGFLGSPDSEPRPATTAPVWPPRGSVRIDLDRFYRDLGKTGYRYGPAFRGLSRAWVAAGRAYAEVTLPATVSDGAGYVIHPAALDAGLQLCAAGALLPVDEGMKLPFCWQSVRVPAARSDRLRITLANLDDRAITVSVCDSDDVPLMSVAALTMRDSAPHLADTARTPSPTAEDLTAKELRWERLRRGQSGEQKPIPDRWSFVGPPPSAVGTNGQIDCHVDVPTLVTELQGSDRPPPGIVWVLPTSASDVDPCPTRAEAAVAEVLIAVQHLLASATLKNTCMFVVTAGAVDTGRGERIDPTATAVWGLVRSIQREEPGRIVLVDSDHTDSLVDQLAMVFASGIDEAALRQGVVLTPKIRRRTEKSIDVDNFTHWQIVPSADGMVDAITAHERPVEAPDAQEVVVAVRAAGVAFRDVMIAHNIYPEPSPLGLEVSGIVVEVGSEVDDLMVGDRVFGYCSGTFADSVTVDYRQLAKVPSEWTFAQAAAIPTAYITAYHALIELAQLKRGDSILIHSAASGTGMAAVFLAQCIGADVYVTASPAKHEFLRSLGIPEDHIASSRDAGFSDRFHAATGGVGVDVAIDAFSGPLVDATLRIMAPQGKFIEIGVRDVRSLSEIETDYPGVAYYPVNMTKFEPGYYGRTFTKIADLICSGGWQGMPIQCWDIRQLRQVLRYMSTGQQTGKHVVVLPTKTTDLSTGTLVISGGTGMAGMHTARHAVQSWGCRSLILLSRSGGYPDAVAALRHEIAEFGAQMQVVVGDVSNRAVMEELSAVAPPGYPISGIVHAAGTLDDVLATQMQRSHLHSVFRSKALGAYHLHEWASNLGISMFAMYSSVAATLGSPGQANYAAANGYLDGLAAFRMARGLPATSVVWGLWSEPSSLTRTALARSDQPLRQLGVLSFDPASALQALDRALHDSDSVVLCASIEQLAPQHNPSSVPIPASMPVRISGLDTALAKVNQEIASTLGLDDSDEVDPDKPFREIGFDSMTAVELRNRLNTATGLRLDASVVFDCNTPHRLAEYIMSSTNP
ncbi:MAG: type I polyketide synthase [Mycolicibacterium neoaurum]|uniref:type I polyketide synthase n=1 Tax=Mycolicibacterium neoaurum TaxID=1795 RepID=UPI002FF8199F